MNKKLLLLVLLCVGNRAASSDYRYSPKAGYLLTKMVNQAQDELGIPKEQQALVYDIHPSLRGKIGGCAYTETKDGKAQNYIHIDFQVLPSYARTRFYALHEATHVNHGDFGMVASVKDKIELGMSMAFAAGLLICSENILNIVDRGVFIGTGICLCGFSNILLSRMLPISSFIVEKTGIETRADTTATIALGCKSCVEDYIKDQGLKHISASSLKRGYLSAEQVRALSETHHTDSRCYYHRSPLPRIFYAIQSAPFEGLPIYTVWQDIQNKKKLQAHQSS